jgi:hypothetical protein
MLANLYTTTTVAYSKHYKRKSELEHHINPKRNQEKQYNIVYKPPPMASTQKQNKCLLCNNQHPNPWHPTEQCPFKDPSLVQNKLIRDNVM